MIISRIAAIFDIIKNIILMMVTFIPGDMGVRVRYRFWKKRLKYLGQNVRIEIGVDFQHPEFIHIEDDCLIDKYVTIIGGIDKSTREKITIKNPAYKGEPGVVFIGKNVHLGIGCIISGISVGVYISDYCCLAAHCKVYAFSHHYRSRRYPEKNSYNFGSIASDDKQCMVEGPIYIGYNSGVAMGVMILPGVNIPDHCFIAVGSVVSSRNFNSNTVISGNPASSKEPRFKIKVLSD
jgi:acetyltransferase-like isoleucine patch superfamily enzyme